MAANSKHPGDIELWLKKICESCETVEQASVTWRWINRLFYDDIISQELYMRYSDKAFYLYKSKGIQRTLNEAKSIRNK